MTREPLPLADSFRRFPSGSSPIQWENENLFQRWIGSTIILFFNFILFRFVPLIEKTAIIWKNSVGNKIAFRVVLD